MAPALRAKLGERREQILAEALKLFAEHGMQRVSTRQIAQAVGISQPSLYAHFRTSDEIADELCDRAFQVLYARMSAASAQPGPPVEQVKRIGLEYVRFALEHPDSYRVALMLEKPMDHTHKEPGLDVGLRAFGVLHDLIVEIRGIDDEKSAAIAQSVWAAMHGLVALLLARSGFPWVDRDLLIQTHLEQVCAGLD